MILNDGVLMTAIDEYGCADLSLIHLFDGKTNLSQVVFGLFG